MQVNPSIFKAYDIRGVVPSTLTEEVATSSVNVEGTTPRMSYALNIEGLTCIL